MKTENHSVPQGVKNSRTLGLNLALRLLTIMGWVGLQNWRDTGQGGQTLG